VSLACLLKCTDIRRIAHAILVDAETHLKVNLCLAFLSDLLERLIPRTGDQLQRLLVCDERAVKVLLVADTDQFSVLVYLKELDVLGQLLELEDLSETYQQASVVRNTRYALGLAKV